MVIGWISQNWRIGLGRQVDPALTVYQEKVLGSCGSRYVLDYITHRVVYKYVGGGTIYPTDVSGVDMVLWEGGGAHIQGRNLSNSVCYMTVM